MKIFDFCKKFSPEKSKGNECRTDFVCLIGRNFKMAKFIRLSDDAVFVFFARTAFFQRGVFSHARVRACGHMRARTHPCNACAFIIGARRTKFQLSAFYDSFAELFHPASSQKAKLRNFRGGEQCGTIQNSGKKREIRLETTEKRLLAAMKGRYTSEKTIKRRKPAKKRGKRKKTKKN